MQIMTIYTKFWSEKYAGKQEFGLNRLRKARMENFD